MNKKVYWKVSKQYMHKCTYISIYIFFFFYIYIYIYIYIIFIYICIYIYAYKYIRYITNMQNYLLYVFYQFTHVSYMYTCLRMPMYINNKVHEMRVMRLKKETFVIYFCHLRT